jgi:hypothetical protein
MARVVVKNKITARLPDHLVEFVQRQIDERGVDITVVIIDALNEYKQRKEHPDLIVQQLRAALRDHPDLLEEPLMVLGARSLKKSPDAH